MGLTVLENKALTVNGLQAYGVLSKQVSQDQSTGQQQTNLLLSYFISHGSNIYVFHGVSTEADFKTYQPSIEATLGSFANLTDPSKINVKPNKLFVRTVSRPGTLQQVLASYGVPQDKMKEVAFLNNMELTASVPAGKLVKVIGQ
jgi:predicted Zn-dependent protease